MPYNFSIIKNKAEKIKEWLKNEISSLRASRANPALIENIMVESYGSKMPLKHISAISVEDAKTLRVSPWDASALKNIEAAIGASNLGVQPIVDKQTIRIILPELSEERRKSLLKLLGEKLEESKISLRKDREEVWKDIQEKEKKGEIPEDDKFRFKDELQKIIDKTSEELEEIAERKEKEIQA
ncbi:ribosome recycling factor [Candidatus Parcubacteria bacterium]|nr:ribosome recycling factor [Patescibacteria group bacterium]MBU4477073.1 ribosome recycling factor [Patescibacteria group bacterium]MCG2699360.1 ribosome recycling factor [Candidatus Parcubacteria bacterium]